MLKKVVKIAKLAVGLLIILLVLCQLFTFEKFPDLLMAAGIVSSGVLLVATTLVIAELLSLPFLINMEAPRGVILVSRVAGFISLGVMTVISVMAVMNEASAVIFGATLKNMNGFVGVLVLAIMGVLLLVVNMPMKKTAK